MSMIIFKIKLRILHSPFPKSWKWIQWNPAVSYIWLIFCLGLKVLNNLLYCIYRGFVSRSRDLDRQGHFWVSLHYYKVFATRLKKISKRAAPADLSTIEKPQKPNRKNETFIIHALWKFEENQHISHRKCTLNVASPSFADTVMHFPFVHSMENTQKSENPMTIANRVKATAASGSLSSVADATMIAVVTAWVI